MQPQMGHEPGLALHIKAGSKLRFQMHYTPNGSEQQDLSYVGFVFADPKEVSHEVHSGFAMQLKLDIPPGAEDYVVNGGASFAKTR